MENGVADPTQDIVSIARAIYPLEKTVSYAKKLEVAAKIERDVEKVESCNDLIALNKNYGSKINGMIENVTIGSFNLPLQNLIKDLKIMTPSKPLSFIDGMSVFMLCTREAQKMLLPSKEDVARVEFDKIFGSLSERFLFRLRRSASIETNL